MKMDKNKIANNFLSFISTQDLSEIGLDASDPEDIREYLEIVEKENGDSLYFLEQEVAPIDDIWSAIDEIEKLI